MRLWKTLGAGCIGLVATLLLLAFGFAPPFAVAWGLALAGLALLPQLGESDDPSSGAPRIDVAPENRTTEISQLSWALNPHTGHAGERVTRRIRGILRHQLELQGIDPDDAADRARCTATLGGDVWDRLNGSATTVADIERALAAIDRLSPTKEKQ